MEQDVLLKMVGISKSFPGVKALDNVSLEVKAGTVHALMGENGAGKSTLMKCLFGIYVKDDGHIYLNGKEVNFKSSREALDNGVAMVHQELNQALKRSVMDNLWLGRYPKIAGIAVNEGKMYKDTKAVFDELGLDIDPRRIMSTMPVSLVEIAKAVSYHSKVIVFDEPTSSLTEEEVEHLFKIINMLRDRGVGIIYISHKMAEIKRISDYITVMRDGQWVATEPADKLKMKDVVRLMVGRELTNQYPPKTNKPGEVYLKVEHLTGMYNQLRDVSFEARRGEILGLAGLDSFGRTETLESIFGIRTRKSGKIYLDGKEVKNRNSGESIKNGFAMLTEERRATGIFSILNIRDNTVIASLKRHKKFGIYLSEKSMKEDTQRYIDTLHTKTPSQETKIRSLSGGNQQKVIIGRWLLTDSNVLLLDEPTRGIDVGALIGLVNGFFVAKFSLHPFIVTLATQLITTGIILWFFDLNGNNGQPISGQDEMYKNFVGGEMFRMGHTSIPMYVLYAILLTILMWFIWNKTTFGKNMFAVGSNTEAARVSGVNVFWTIVLVHTLAGAMYGYAGFIDGVRAGSVSSVSGMNAECDAIAACVIGCVSFVGGTGKISGIVLGVLILRLIFVALTMLGVSPAALYLIKGAIILCACALDMRKYLIKK